MGGPELVVGGWSASAAIDNLVGMARSYLANNATLNSETNDMLDELQASLPRIQAMIDAGERISVDRASPIPRRSGAATWLQELKDAAHDAEDVLDDFEAKEIKEKIKGKVSVMVSSALRPLSNLFPDADVKRLRGAIQAIKKKCDNGNFILGLQNSDLVPDTRENAAFRARTGTSPFIDASEVVGRDEDIALILDMILANSTSAPTSTENSGGGYDKAESSQTGWIIDAVRRVSTAQSIEHGMNPGIELSRKRGIQIEEVQASRSGGETEEPQPSWKREKVRGLDPSKQAMATGEAQSSEKGKGVAGEHSHLQGKFSAQGDHEVGVLPIIGVGGIGKTTVAQMVFNHESVKKHFDLRGWLFMPDTVDEKQFIVQIIQSFGKSCSEIENLQYFPNQRIQRGNFRGFQNLWPVLNKLTEVVRGKRFLIVLDDVWNDKFLKRGSNLRGVLRAGDPGSVILVTTELQSVATLVATMGPIVLNSLKEEFTWKIFERDAFSSCWIEPSRRFDLEYIGRGIVKKLHGIPLAAKTIGSSLSLKLDKEYWKKVLDSPWWSIAKGGVREQILPSMFISYYNLTRSQRQCFLYCSVFPRYCAFEKARLIQMWISHGFIETEYKGNNRLENEEGSKWIDDLLDRSYLQPTVWKDLYIMHPLMRDFAVAISSHEYCTLINDEMDVPKFLRHLSINKDNFCVRWGDCDPKRLRTLLRFGYCKVDRAMPELGVHILRSSTGLRVLDLSHITLGDKQNDFLSAIGQLLHLRYVDLSFTGISELPYSFCSLCHLQVLDLRGCPIIELPRKMNMLINLCHLRAEGSATSLIYAIGKLTKLQELHEFYVQDEDGHRITELRDLKDIGGSLCISNLQMVANGEEAHKAILCAKNHLTLLDLRWNGRTAFAKEILRSLSPPKELEELKISEYPGSSFPDWVEQVEYLRVVYISKCTNLQILPPLGQLACLKKLNLSKLHSITYVNSELYGTSNVAFPSLEELIFEDMAKWENWEDSGNCVLLPKLQKLQITCCYRLSKVPCASLGSTTEVLILSGCSSFANTLSEYLQKLTALTTLHIDGCGGKLTLPCQKLSSLKHLHLSRCSNVLFKGGPLYLRKLKTLHIIYCPRITTAVDEELLYVPTQEDGIMQSLAYLRMNDLSQSKDLDDILFKIPALRTLCLVELSQFTTTHELWLQELASLQELQFRQCYSLKHLPENLSALSSLKKLKLTGCKEIERLPESGLPHNLEELQITYCSDMLQARCQKENGEGPRKKMKEGLLENYGKDWQKIAHVPLIHINRETVQNLYI